MKRRFRFRSDAEETSGLPGESAVEEALTNLDIADDDTEVERSVAAPPPVTSGRAARTAVPEIIRPPAPDSETISSGLGIDADDLEDDVHVGDDEIDADELDADQLDDEDFLELARPRREITAEQRSAWAYLGVLGGLFCFLLLFGYACSDQRGSEVAGTDSVDPLTGSEPSRLVFSVDGDVIAVQGTVPDQAARDQLLAAAQAAYGPENVVDELTVDEGTTLETGTVRFVGSAAFGDERPEMLQESVGSTFGLANRGFEVGFVETVLGAVSAEVAIEGDRVTLTGALPDEQSVADMQQVAGEVWGEPNVDGSGLTVGDTTWTDGVIRVTGSTVTTDTRVSAFDQLVTERIGTLVNVDTASLTIVDNRARIAEVQAVVDDLVTTTPIQFAPNSPVISDGSDEVLNQLASALNELPDIPFEVVGHTDNVGPEQDNLVLSQQRAAAVVERLTELGVDAGRMSSRGEGEANPIADNATTEGKAANRRIEFVLIGTSESEEPSE